MIFRRLRNTISQLRIVSQLKYCGRPASEAEKLENTYNTLHKELRVLPQIYRKCGYMRFSVLMLTLMLAEKNKELLIKNHNSRTTGTRVFPEVNAMTIKNWERQNQTNRGCGSRFNNKRRKTYNPIWKG